MGKDREDRPGGGGGLKADGDWDHELELGDDLRAEHRLLWKEAVVFMLVLAVAAVRIFLV